MPMPDLLKALGRLRVQTDRLVYLGCGRGEKWEWRGKNR